LNIALDYDATYTRDPKFWDEFVELAGKHGHEVVCVTKREPELGTPGLSVRAVFSSRRAKRPAASNAGIPISVWIDDTPESILFDDGVTLQYA